MGDRLQESAVDYGVAVSPLPGEPVTGDRYVMLPTPTRILLGVIDGLGHGVEAAHAADLAVDAIKENPSASLQELVQHCHAALRKTRGAVMTLVALEPQSATLSWLGVGNVEAILVPAEEEARRQVPLLRGGVVGHQLPRLKISHHELSPGDLIILATDGIDRGFSESVTASDEPQRIADFLLENCGKDTDDALVFVARYVGAMR